MPCLSQKNVTLMPLSSTELMLSKPSSSHKKNVSLGDLPNGCWLNWCRKFIPTYLEYIGQHEETWDLTVQDELLAKQQKIWDIVFPESLMKLTLSGPICCLVCCIPHFFQCMRALSDAILPQSWVLPTLKPCAPYK
jgi:hypothetical protein